MRPQGRCARKSARAGAGCSQSAAVANGSASSSGNNNNNNAPQNGHQAQQVATQPDSNGPRGNFVRQDKSYLSASKSSIQRNASNQNVGALQPVANTFPTNAGRPKSAADQTIAREANTKLNHNHIHSNKNYHQQAARNQKRPNSMSAGQNHRQSANQTNPSRAQQPNSANRQEQRKPPAGSISLTQFLNAPPTSQPRGQRSLSTSSSLASSTSSSPCSSMLHLCAQQQQQQQQQQIYMIPQLRSSQQVNSYHGQQQPMGAGLAACGSSASSTCSSSADSGARPTSSGSIDNPLAALLRSAASIGGPSPSPVDCFQPDPLWIYHTLQRKQHQLLHQDHQQPTHPHPHPNHLHPHSHHHHQQQQPQRQLVANNLEQLYPVPPPRPWIEQSQSSSQSQSRLAGELLSRKQLRQRRYQDRNQDHIQATQTRVQTSSSNSNEFTVISYNVLCDRMVKSDMFPCSPDLALNWHYRRELILRQLIEFDADIVALQELEMEQYESYFRPRLAQSSSYESIFEPKSRARTMDLQKRKRVDGCAIFFKANKFKLVQRHLLEFSRIAMANARGSDAMVNRVMTKDNIGLAAILEFVEPVGAPTASTGTSAGSWCRRNKRRQNQDGTKQSLRQAEGKRHLLVCNTHIHWDPEYCDVKLVQTIMLMNELRSIAKHYRQLEQQLHRDQQTHRRLIQRRLTTLHHHQTTTCGELELFAADELADELSSLSSSGLSTYSQHSSLPDTDQCENNDDVDDDADDDDGEDVDYAQQGGDYGDELAPKRDQCEDSLMPLVLLGDFNSLPDSGVTSYLTSGHISSQHEDFQNYHYTACTNTLSVQAAAISAGASSGTSSPTCSASASTGAHSKRTSTTAAVAAATATTTTTAATTAASRSILSSQARLSIATVPMDAQAALSPPSCGQQFSEASSAPTERLRRQSSPGWCFYTPTGGPQISGSPGSDSLLVASPVLSSFGSTELAIDEDSSSSAFVSAAETTSSSTPSSSLSLLSSSSSSSSSSCSAGQPAAPGRPEETILSYAHPFELASAYANDTMPYTNYTTTFKATIDYIFYSRNSIALTGLLGPLDLNWMRGNRIRGLPQPHLPSDHLPLMARLSLEPAGADCGPSVAANAQRPLAPAKSPCRARTSLIKRTTRS